MELFSGGGGGCLLSAKPGGGREGSGSNTPSRGRVVAGGTLAQSTPGKNGKVFSSHLFSIFCFGNGTDLCSLYLYHLQVWKR